MGKEGGNMCQICENKTFILLFCDLWKWWEFEKNIFFRNFYPVCGGKDVRGTLCILFSSYATPFCHLYPTDCKLLLLSKLVQVVALLTWVQELLSSDSSRGRLSWLRIFAVFFGLCQQVFR